jgi:hypothetical protein
MVDGETVLVKVHRKPDCGEDLGENVDGLATGLTDFFSHHPLP